MRERKRTKLFLILSFVMVVLTAMLGSRIIRLNADSFSLQDKASIDFIAIKNGDIDLVTCDPADRKLTFGDKVYIDLDWTFNTDTEIKVNEDEFVYDLTASGLTLTNYSSGSLTEDKDGVTLTHGTYSIVDNKIIIKYTDAEFCSGTNRKGHVNFEASVEDNGTHPATVDITFPNNAVNMTVTMVQPSGGQAMVSVDAKSFSGGENYVYQGVVNATSWGVNTNVVLTDTLWPGATYTSIDDVTVTNPTTGAVIDSSRYTKTISHNDQTEQDILTITFLTPLADEEKSPLSPSYMTQANSASSMENMSMPYSRNMGRIISQSLSLLKVYPFCLRTSRCFSNP